MNTTRIKVRVTIATILLILASLACTIEIEDHGGDLPVCQRQTNGRLVCVE